MTKRDQLTPKKVKKQNLTFDEDEVKTPPENKRELEKKSPKKNKSKAKDKRIFSTKFTSKKATMSLTSSKLHRGNHEVFKEGVKINEAVCANIKKFEETIKLSIAKSPEKTLESYFDTFLKPFVPPKTAALVGSAPENRTKNRTAHPCYDHTRVKLQVENKEIYINANSVAFEDIKKQYIMTQYPLPDSLEDFWTMAFENDVELIITIFNPMGDAEIPEYKERIEAAAMKTAVLGPSSAQTTSVKGKLTSRERSFRMNECQTTIAESSKRCALTDSMCYFPLLEGQYMTIGRYFVHTRKVELHDRSYRPTTYTVEVLPEGCSECKFIRVVNYPKWDKKKMPSNPKAVASLIRAIALDPLHKGPIIVHCDTGIDRSASFVMSDVLITTIFESKSIDIDEIFKKIRSQRAGCFQTANYFTYAVYVSLHYVRARAMKKGMIDRPTFDILNGLISTFAEKYKSAEEV